MTTTVIIKAQRNDEMIAQISRPKTSSIEI